MKDNISHTPPEAETPRAESEKKDFDSSSIQVERLEDQAVGTNTKFVDRETERAVTRKLDWRIIPMIMWVYLMNMMDRGMYLTWKTGSRSIT